MRILFVIPHFVNPDGGGKYGSLGPNSNLRINSLANCLMALKYLFSKQQYMLDISIRHATPANNTHDYDIDIIICTTGKFYLLDNLPPHLKVYKHHPANVEPLLLEFECQAVLRDNFGKYDYYCFIEDDLIIHDPYFFTKLNWFNNNVKDSCLLQPNRYEVSSSQIAYKTYIDGNINPRATAGFQDININPIIEGSVMGERIIFKRPLNPHSASYFLNAQQMEHWIKQPYFLDYDTSFIGPLESAATLGIMRTFKIYKPAPVNANFLEIQHSGTAFISQIGTRIPVY